MVPKHTRKQNTHIHKIKLRVGLKEKLLLLHLLIFIQGEAAMSCLWKSTDNLGESVPPWRSTQVIRVGGKCHNSPSPPPSSTYVFFSPTFSMSRAAILGIMMRACGWSLTSSFHAHALHSCFAFSPQNPACYPQTQGTAMTT